MPSIIVKDSKIHGKGVFANKDFKKGEVVVDWSTCSKKISEKKVKLMPEEQRKFISYFEDTGYILFSAPAIYVNHSCDANTKKGDGMFDVALRDIKKGEEITADYVKEKALVKFKCTCGTKNCRGIIDNRV